MELTSKSVSYDSEWHHSDPPKISHDLLRLQWWVQDKNSISSSDQGWPNTLDESVSVKKIVLLYAFQKSSPFFFPLPDPHLLAMDCLFSKHNILVFIFSACAIAFFFLCWYLLFWFPLFTSMLPSPPSCFSSIPILLMHFSFILSLPWVHCQIRA